MDANRVPLKKLVTLLCPECLHKLAEALNGRRRLEPCPECQTKINNSKETP